MPLCYVARWLFKSNHFSIRQCLGQVDRRPSNPKSWDEQEGRRRPSPSLSVAWTASRTGGMELSMPH